MTTRRLVLEATPEETLAREIARLRRELDDLRGTVLARLRSMTGGNNANGVWSVSSGLLVCRQALSVPANPTVWTFPRAFATTSDLAVTATARSTGALRVATTGAPTTTAVDVLVFNAAGSHVTTTVVLIAVGRA